MKHISIPLISALAVASIFGALIAFSGDPSVADAALSEGANEGGVRLGPPNPDEWQPRDSGCVPCGEETGDMMQSSYKSGLSGPKFA